MLLLAIIGKMKWRNRMNKKNKILTTFLVLLVITSLFIENQNIETLLVVAMPIVIIIKNLTDYIVRKKIIKQINDDNMTYIKVKDNNKGIILLAVIFMVNIYTVFKSVLSIYPIQNYKSFLGIISYFNRFDYSNRMLIVSCIMLLLLSISMIIQVLFSSSIITDDKLIFYDNLVFDFNKIEEIKYKEHLIFKNKKIITLSKGFIDKSLVIKIDEFDKVKDLLESKITL